MDSHNNDNNKQLALNRSSSFSGSPITRKICVEQSYKNDKGETLIRQYSCEQIYDRSNKNPTIQLKESVVIHSPRKLKSLVSYDDSALLEKFPFTSQATNLFNFQKNCPEQEGFTQSLMYNNLKEDKIQECTPMDVDTSTEDYPMRDVHSGKENENSEDHLPKISKLTFPLKEKGDVKLVKSQIFKQYLKFILIFLIPIICAILFLHINTDTVSVNFEFENITNDIQKLLYGQPEVVAQIKDSLSHLRDRHLLIFTGGVGVGKTYTTNIISRNFPWKNNIFKTTSQFKNIKLNDGYNLVIVDNLEINDKSVISFVKKLYSTDKKVIIILIYTIPELSVDMSSGMDLITTSNKISESFSELKHSLVVFHKLNEDVVKKCISFAMTQKGLNVNERNVENILESVNYKYSGCKGVYTKVALLR